MRMKPAALSLARGSWAEAMTLNSSSVSGGTCCLGPMRTSFKIASRSMNTALFIVAKKQIPGLTPRIEQKSSSSLKNNAFQHEVGSQLCEKPADTHRGPHRARARQRPRRKFGRARRLLCRKTQEKQ